jgi:hypothetical protein
MAGLHREGKIPEAIEEADVQLAMRAKAIPCRSKRRQPGRFSMSGRSLTGWN